MLCSPTGFSPQERLSVTASSWSNWGREYGILSRPVTEHRWHTLRALITHKEQALLVHIPLYKKSLFQMSTSPKFAIDGVNWFGVYRDILEGFAVGSDMPLNDIIALQIIDNIMCQTLIVQEKESQKTVILHMEESTSDDSLNSTKEPAYDYRVVNAEVGRSKSQFFAYPGLCFGGPAIGCNKNTNSLIVVDSLYMEPFVLNAYSIWGNAVASVAFLLGTKQKIEKLVNICTRERVGYIDGYAIHCVEKKERTVSLSSLEYGGDTMAIAPPDQTDERLFIAQPNLSRSKPIIVWDPLHQEPNDPMSIEMARRAIRLKQWAQCLPIVDTFTTQKNILSALCQYSPGDRYEDGGQSETGFLTDMVASYVFGLVTPNQSQISIGKGLPPKSKDGKTATQIKELASSILPPITIHYE
jgi:hypothetical protein